MEPAPHRGIHQSDGPVGGVHSTDDPQILGELKRLVGPVKRTNALLAIFEQEQQLTENFGEVGSVDLVDHQYKLLRGVLLRPVGDEIEGTFHQPIGELALGIGLRAEPLEEILIRGGRVELDQHALRPVGSECSGKLLRHVGLSGPRRSVEDHLAPLLQQIDHLVEKGSIEMNLVSKVANPVDFFGFDSGFLTLGEPVQEPSRAVGVIAEEWPESLDDEVVGADQPGTDVEAIDPLFVQIEQSKHARFALLPSVDVDGEDLRGILDSQQFGDDSFSETFDSLVVLVHEGIDAYLEGVFAAQEVLQVVGKHVEFLGAHLAERRVEARLRPWRAVTRGVVDTPELVEVEPK
ncbi:hypothetical protein BMS3Bbin01_02925 [bacterium BMS3Bbin01]|nr:hypothetical protein BMS3Bbin01_02925 [bacterium BMS3Bbin01]